LGSVLLLRLLRAIKLDFYFEQHLIEFQSVIGRGFDSYWNKAQNAQFYIPCNPLL